MMELPAKSSHVSIGGETVGLVGRIEFLLCLVLHSCISRKTLVIDDQERLIMELPFPLASVTVQMYCCCFLYRVASKKTRNLSQKFGAETETRASVI